MLYPESSHEFASTARPTGGSPADPRAGLVRPVDARLILAREALIDDVDLSADGELVSTAAAHRVAGANVRRLGTCRSPVAGRGR